MPAEFDANAGPYPVLIFLHGAGERGADNSAQLKHGKDFLLRAANEQQCFVIAPQCPRSKRWTEVDWFAATHKMPEQPSDPMGLLLEMLDKMQKQYPLDTQRFYVMGLSMGGYGTWDLLQRCPGKFAAAVPICGGGDETGAAEIVKTSVWAFHGDKDGARARGSQPQHDQGAEGSRRRAEVHRVCRGRPRHLEPCVPGPRSSQVAVYPEAVHQSKSRVRLGPPADLMSGVHLVRTGWTGSLATHVGLGRQAMRGPRRRVAPTCLAAAPVFPSVSTPCLPRASPCLPRVSRV